MKNFTLILALLSLSSCGYGGNDIQVKGTDEGGNDGLLASAEAAPPSREAVYIYNDRTSSRRKIILHLGGEPSLLSSGYVRLVGVVRGGSPTACLEIGGRGLAVSIGETVDGFSIRQINSTSVVMSFSKSVGF